MEDTGGSNRKEDSDRNASIRYRKLQEQTTGQNDDAKNTADTSGRGFFANNINISHRPEGTRIDPSFGAIPTHDYAQAFRQWLWQYQWWMNSQMSMMYMFSMYPMNYLPATPYQNTQQAPVVNGAGATPPVNGARPGHAAGQTFGPGRAAQQMQNGLNQQLARGRECRLPALWKRVVAEFIDFFLLFMIKLAASIMVIEYIGLLDLEKYDIEQLLHQDWDSNTALSFTSDLIAMEFINRVFICLFETLCLRRGFTGSVGGTTPGKYMMRLRVISCLGVAQLPGNKVLVIPGEDIGFWNALLRSVIKNFSLVFFFPVCFTIFFFPNSRTAYDIASCSIVVEVTPEDAWAWPRR